MKETIKKSFKALKNRLFIKQNLYFNDGNYNSWIKNNEPTYEELEEQKRKKFKIAPKFSIIVPMYNTPLQYFEELVNCVINQTYTNLELCLADGSEYKNEKFDSIIQKDSRIIYKFLNENKGISGNTNAALEMATGDYIMLLDHDDLLPIFCLYEIVKKINENSELEFIYTDEDHIEKNKRCKPHFKPDFAIDTLRSNNYITHLSIFKKELIDKIGGFRDEFNGAQDYDMILRAIENTSKIAHIPLILYNWRIHTNSTSMLATAKPYAYEAGKKAIESHLERQKIEAKVTHQEDLKGTYEIEYKIIGNPSVAIIIPNKDNVKLLKKCINSILELTTYKNYEIVIIENNSTNKKTFEYYKQIEQNERIRVLTYKEKGFNYSKIVNYGVRNCKSDFIIQLNNDTKLLTEQWIEKFIGFAQREDVGAVGAKLYYKDKSIQHSGIGIGILELAANLFVNTPKNAHAYFARESTIRNVSAVTGACLCSRREIYEEVGYMDEENFKVAFNDVDLCLKIRKKGYLIIYNPFVKFIHYESKTRGYENTIEKKQRFKNECNNFKEKWKKEIEAGDPYSNINFLQNTAHYKVRPDNVKKVN